MPMLLMMMTMLLRAAYDTPVMRQRPDRRSDDSDITQ
jgi:hypothetical protein